MSGKPMSQRLSRAQRAAMLNDYLAGVKLAAIAAEYGVSESYPGHYARKLSYPPRRPWNNPRYVPAPERAGPGLAYAPQTTT